MDWKRMLLGDAPVVFLVEVLIRTMVVYVALVIVLRIFGKRMAGQLTVLEMAVMVTLGAIVSLPMQAPDRGVLVGMLLLVTTLIMQRGLGRLGFERRRVELLSQGEASPLVKDGVILTDQLRDAALSRHQLFGVLRGKGIRQMGEVKRVYLEACGEMSIFRRDEPAPGLWILPPDDGEMVERRSLADGRLACVSCARVAPPEAGARPCDSCGARDWVEAVR